ncbi:hypothetical protein MLP_21410 [Microlunatus phosphovorus NM-1]|uniref:Lipoprotein n=2 Tax=Microlunatus phosphovorus TaxID=29405 RepID=F5XDY2_MICPN|nr:hypothetical protein MLP_21410 [Microlunatus phosphovorus NM-1]
MPIQSRIFVRSAVSVLTSIAAMAALTSCSGSAEPEQSGTPAPTSAAPSSPGPSSAATESAPASPTPGSGTVSAAPPSAGTTPVTAADGAISWTLPCAKPRTQTMDLNKRAKKVIKSMTGWACGQGAGTTAGVFVVELQKTPATDDDAHRELRGLVEQALSGAEKPKHGTFQGHPGISGQVKIRSDSATGYQAVAVGPWLAVFAMTPPDDLSELVDTVRVN